MLPSDTGTVQSNHVKGQAMSQCWQIFPLLHISVTLLHSPLITNSLYRYADKCAPNFLKSLSTQFSSFLCYGFFLFIEVQPFHTFPGVQPAFERICNAIMHSSAL